MISTGCDIEKISRFDKITGNKVFLAKVFTSAEIRSCMISKRPGAQLAESFASKEAVFKALSSLGVDVPLRCIETVRKAARIIGCFVKHKNVSRQYNVFLSSSKTLDLAVAFSVVERI